MAQKLKIPRVSDRRIYEVYQLISREFGVSSSHASALGFTPIGSFSLAGEPSGDFAKLLEFDSYLLENLTCTVQNLAISFHRGGSTETKSPVYDEIDFSPSGNQQLPTPQRLALIALINRELKPFDVGAPQGFLSVEHEQSIALQQNALQRLQELAEDVIRKGSEFRANTESEFAHKLANLEQQTADRKVELESQFDERVKKLDERETELRDLQKRLDDRNNTHARRAIRETMLSDVKSRIKEFGVSAATESKRTSVANGIAGLVCFLAIMLIWASIDIHGSTTHDADFYIDWVRFGVATFALLATLLYYVRWQNKWAEQHSNTEFQLQQFYIDVNRANWVIESCLEWRKETQQSRIPRELLESVTRNLFVRDGIDTEPAVHPADELASALLGSASRLKLKVGENELNYDKPQKIKK